jgi:hypothetical protein
LGVIGRRHGLARRVRLSVAEPHAGEGVARGAAASAAAAARL